MDAGEPDHETRALCVQLALLRSIIQGQAGIPFPCPGGKALWIGVMMQP